MAQRRSVHSRRQQSVDYPRYPPQNALQIQHPPPLQQPVHISDYESDNQANLSDYPHKPPPASRTNDELNLSVLQRYNNQITSILSIAPFAVIYQFSPVPEPTWSKAEIEGSLFICQLTPGIYQEDRYLALVLNRRGLNNFEAELRESENAGIEITDEYVIISSKEAHEQKIHGIFIFSGGPGSSTEHTRTLNADLMKQLAVQADLSRRAAEAEAVAATAKHTNGHMQEAEASLEDNGSGVPMGRQQSLQQHFGQQRVEDASWSARAHNMGYAQDGNNYNPNTNFRSQQGGYAIANSKPDILGDLFRKAGLGV